MEAMAIIAVYGQAMFTIYSPRDYRSDIRSREATTTMAVVAVSSSYKTLAPYTDTNDSEQRLRHERQTIETTHFTTTSKAQFSSLDNLQQYKILAPLPHVPVPTMLKDTESEQRLCHGRQANYFTTNINSKT